MMANRNQWQRKAIVLLPFLFVICLHGCVGPPEELPGTWDFSYMEPDGEGLSHGLLLVADNQMHNLYADPVALKRTLGADRYVPTAIRPVQLDFFGQEFLEYAVEEGSDGLFVIHLGDACDLSCTGEFAHFCWIMRKAPAGWVMAPGNHDGFFFGNEQLDPETSSQWKGACNHSGKPMSKDLTVRYYLAALLLQDRKDTAALADSLGLDIDPLPYDKALMMTLEDYTERLDAVSEMIPSGPGSCKYSQSSDRNLPYLTRAAWNINEEDRWESYIVQHLELSKPDTDKTVGALLLDTAQYSLAPKLLPILPGYCNAGLNGQVLEDQLETVIEWIENRKNEDRTWVVMGHHPFDTLTGGTQSDIEELRKTAGFQLYVSAHSHKGEFRVLNAKDKPNAWMELNVGSILDWPLEYRTLTFFDYEGRVGFRSIRSTILEDIKDDLLLPEDKKKWEAKPEGDDAYLRYAHESTLSSVETERKLKNALLGVHKRMLKYADSQNNSSDHEEMIQQIEEVVKKDKSLEEKTALLLELDCYVRDLSQSSDILKYYKLSQALWASRYEHTYGRKPLVDDWFFVFPKEGDS